MRRQGILLYIIDLLIVFSLLKSLMHQIQPDLSDIIQQFILKKEARLFTQPRLFSTGLPVLFCIYCL